MKTVTARQAGLEAFENDDFRCAKGQRGVLDDAFMGCFWMMTLRHSQQPHHRHLAG